jgi:hypothetical protein
MLYASGLTATTVATALAALFLAATALGLALLAALGDAGLLVEATTLQLAADALAANLSLETVERAVDIIVADFNLDRS